MQKPVIVTTNFKGVFFGYIEETDMKETTIVLKNCRNVIYWSCKGGFLSLCTTIESGSKLGSIAPEITLHNVTSIAVCTGEQAQRLLDWSN